MSSTPSIPFDPATLNLLPGSIWIGSGEGHCLFANRSLCALLDRPASDLLGELWRLHIPTPDLPRLLEALKQNASKRETFRTHIRVLTRDRIRSLRAEGHFVSLTPESPPVLVLSLHDITNFTRSSLKRQLRSEQLRICFEHAPAAMAFLNDELRIERANPAFQSLGRPETGLSVEGRSLGEALCRSMDFRSVRQILTVCENTLATGTPHTLQRWPVSSANPAEDGPRFLDWEIRRIQTTEGLPVGLLLTLNDVTDQKIAEDRLRLLASVLETTKDFVSVHAPDERVLFLNHSARMALGLDQNPPVRRLELGDMLPAWACKIVQTKGFPQAIQTGSWEGETAFRNRDGVELPVSQLICAHRNTAGEVEFLSSILRDISERKAIESMRVEWANRYDLAIRASGQLLFDWDIHSGEITYAGDAVRVLGVTVEELSGGIGRLRSLVHADDRREFDRRMGEIIGTADIGTAEPLLHEFRVPHGAGGVVHVQARGFMLARNGGNLARMIGFLEDVTLAHEFKESQSRSQETLERRVRERTAELAAATSEIEDRALQQASIARLGERALSGLAIPELLNEAARMLVHILRTDFCSIRELTADGEWLALRGAAGWPSEMAPESLRAGKHSQSGFAVISGSPVIVEDMAAEGRFGISESVRKTGCRSSASVLIAYEEKALGAVSVFSRTLRSFTQDETHYMQAVANVIAAAMERQRSADGLLQAREVAERASRAKGIFLSRMSHELRTPLNAILGFAQLLEIENQNPSFGESIGHITRAGHHLLALINDVLDMAKIEAGRIPLNLEAVDVGSLLMASIELMQPIADRNRIVMRMRKSKRVHLAKGDRLRIKQIVLNFLSNAIKYSPPDSTVEAGIQKRADCVRLWIKDQGPGIPEHKRDRLFHPFERLGAEESSVEGTGIGLSLCRGLVEAMHGAIGLQSPETGGALFWAEIPLLETREGAPGRVDRGGGRPATDGVRPGYASGRIKVLCVDSHPSDIELLESMLGKLPEYSLITALQGDLALELAREHRPEVILIDPELADMSFEEFMQRKQTDSFLNEVPLVVTSAEAALPAVAIHSKKRVLHLRKPMVTGLLRESLETATRTRN